MRIRSFLTAAGLAVILTSGCNKPEPPKEPEYKLSSTMREIMGSMVMPSANVLWNAVSSSVTAKGIEEKAPKTEQEWKDVRDSAITLMEACDLILIPGRRVAKAGEISKDPVNLTPEEIDALIHKDPVTWTKMTHDLHDSILPALKAIDARNAMALSDAGEAIDKACETCHLKFYYPKDAKNK